MTTATESIAGIDKVLAVNDDLPIRTEQKVHSGKVRSVYWLSNEDSRRLIESHQYPVASDSELAVMVISDRISAFECIWQGEGGLAGVPGKGATLNAISHHWFKQFNAAGLARSHILDVPHPLVWIVQKAKPVMIEAIARQYITGSMWRDYDKGMREFCGHRLPDGLQRDQKLPELLITPTTKGILKNIPGVLEMDDVNINRSDIESHYQAFAFKSIEDIGRYETLLKQGFDLISDQLAALDQIFVDTKFEFGYAKNQQGEDELIYMDEVGTPDSSRIWDGPGYREGRVVENSKEVFRQLLLDHVPEPQLLLDKTRMDQRLQLAKNTVVPRDILFKVSETFLNLAAKITGESLHLPTDPRAEILDVLNSRYQLIR